MCLVGNKRAEIARVVPCENNFCTKYAHHLHFCGLQKLNTLNLRHFHPPLNPCNHFSTVLIKTNWNTISCKYHDCKSLRAIYVYAEKVPILPYNSCAFEGCDSKKCKVYVPIGTYDAYSRSQFGYFENIVEFDASSFRNTIATAENQDTTHYFVNDKEEHTH